MCIYEYSLLTSCESSAEKLTEVRIFGLDFFFFVSDLYDIGIRVVGTSRSQYKCVHEIERSRIYAFLGSFGVNCGCSGYEILHETEHFEVKEGQDGPVV